MSDRVSDAEIARLKDEMIKRIGQYWRFCPWCGKPPQRHRGEMVDCLRAAAVAAQLERP